MKPILLVGIDFSNSSLAALHLAARLCEPLGSVVDVLHVVEEGREKRSLTSEETSWLAMAGVDPGAITIRRGVPWIELTRRANEVPAAYVIIGRHGRSGWQPLALGSTAARLAVSAPCPVLLVESHRAGLGVPEHGNAQYKSARPYGH